MHKVDTKLTNWKPMKSHCCYTTQSYFIGQKSNQRGAKPMKRYIRRRRARTRDIAVIRWMTGIVKAGMPEPTEEMIDSMKKGFNMGFRARDNEH